MRHDDSAALPSHIGPYRLCEQLGAGGMGVVHRAVRDDLGQEVALKLIHADEVGDDEVRRRFVREARAASELGDHPGVVAVRDSGEVGGRIWLAMDLVAGDSLDEVLDAGHLDPRAAATIVAQAARAVQHAHDHGILHRDIKPANILVVGWQGARDTATAPGPLTALVADFGLARWPRADADVSKLTKTGFVVGTPAYMSPELARAEVIDGRSDVYALGAALYECLAGRPPFVGHSLVQIFTDLLRTPPVPPHRFNAAVPGELEHIALRCLEKHPDDRYQTAAALADDLERFLAGRPLASGARPWRRSVTQWLQRRPVTSAAVLAALGTAITLWVVVRWMPAGPASGPAPATVPDQTALVELALRTTAAMQGLQAESGAALRLLEDAWQGAPVASERRAEAMHHVERAVEAARTRFPGSTIPDAWLGLACYVAEDADRANALLQRAVDGAGVDPMPALLLARLALADWAAKAALPQVSLDSAGVHMAPFVEDARQRATRERALAALERARQSPLWTALDVSMDARPFLDGARLLAERRYDAAASALATAREIPPLEREAQSLLALAWYLSGRYQDAARGWATLGRLGWLTALRHAGTGFAAAAAARSARGEDPVPPLEEATRLLGDLPTGIDPHNRGVLLQDAARAWRALGEALDDRGRDPYAAYDAAARALDEAATLLPDDADIPFERGWLLGARADADDARGRDPRPGWTQAIAAYQACLERAPDRLQAVNNRGNAWICWANAARERGADTGDALQRGVADFTTMVEAQPTVAANRANRATAWRLWALAMRDRGEDARPAVDRAIDDATAAIELDPDYPLAWATRGTAWWNRGVMEEEHGLDPRQSYRHAVEDHTRSLDLHPGWVMGHLNRSAARVSLANAQRQRGGDPAPGLAGALADADAAVALAPDSAKGHAARAVVHVRRAHWAFEQHQDPGAHAAAALESAEAALARNAGNVDALLAGATAYELQGYAAEASGADPRPHWTGAADMAARWVAAYPRHPHPRLARAQGLQHLGEAEARFQIDPRPRYRAAIAELDQAIALDPRSVRAFLARGELHNLVGTIERQLGDATAVFEAALADFTAAVALQPDAWLALGYGAQTLRLLDRGAEAREWAARCAAAAPDTPQARDFVAGLKRLVGE